MASKDSRNTDDNSIKEKVIYVEDDSPIRTGTADNDPVIYVDDDSPNIDQATGVDYIPPSENKRSNRKRVAPGASSSNTAALPTHGKTQKKKVAKVEDKVPPTADKSSKRKRVAQGADSNSNKMCVAPGSSGSSNKMSVAPGPTSSSNTKRVAPAESSGAEAAISPPRKTPKKKAAKVEEKRDGRIRTITQAIRDRVARAVGQRLFLIERKDTSTEGSIGQEFTVLGSTGNVYKVTIDKHPRCDCPDHMKGNVCKHILFVFLKVLRTPRDSYIICQRALLQHELQEVFNQAPKRNDRVRASAAVRAAYSGGSAEEAAGPSTDKRKAIDEEPCSICFDEITKSDDTQGKVVWCETGCGHNFHKQCMQMWLGSKHSAAEKTCPLCRTLWSRPNSAQGTGGGQPEGEEGYVNLGQLQPGVSTERDTSTYSEWGYSGHCGSRYRRGWF